MSVIDICQQCLSVEFNGNISMNVLEEEKGLVVKREIAIPGSIYIEMV